MITLEQIRERIIQAIQQSGIKKSEIARQLNISHTQISCYIHGRKMPALDTLANMCKILDIDANFILCLTAN